MPIQNFQEIVVWQKAHKLCLLIYRITAKFPGAEEFGLKSQLRRNGVSVPSNFVEGYKRRSKDDAVRFYVIAESSLEEMKYQLLLSKDLRYIPDNEYQEAFDLTEEVGRLLFAWKSNQR